MSWISIVLYFLMNLPKIISLVREIMSIIRGLPKDEAASVKSQLEEAIRYHRETKDDSKIIELHKKVCTGTACPADLVS